MGDVDRDHYHHHGHVLLLGPARDPPYALSNPVDGPHHSQTRRTVLVLTIIVPNQPNIFLVDPDLADRRLKDLEGGMLDYHDEARGCRRDLIGGTHMGFLQMIWNRLPRLDRGIRGLTRRKSGDQDPFRPWLRARSSAQQPRVYRNQNQNQNRRQVKLFPD